MNALRYKPTEIYYANLLPGTGKTFWAIDRLVQCVDSKSGIFIYVAPTLILLDEVAKKVRQRIKNPKDASRVYLISSKDPSLYGTRTADHLLLLLDGGEHRDGTPIVPVTEGSVILCTHETFLKLPSEEHDISRRDLISVIFDEARKCILSEGEFSLPSDTFALLTEEYLDIDPTPGKFHRVKLQKGAAVESPKFTALFSDPKGRPAVQAKLNQMRDLISSLASSNVDLYSKFALVSRNKKEDAETFCLQTILVPTRAFNGWRKVILLSAFFEHSQLFHLLNRNNVSRLSSHSGRERAEFLISSNQGKTALKIIPVNRGIVKDSRVKKIESRYSNLTITYISEHSSFTMRLLKNGIILDEKGMEHAEELAVRFSAFNSNNHAKGKKARSLRKLRTQWLAGTGEPSVLNVFKNIPTNEYLKYTPLEFYALMATRLASAWNKRERVTNPLPLLISANVGDSRNTFWDKEIKPLPIEHDLICQVPFGCHGLNTWIDHDTLAFLSTINPTPLTEQLLGQLCPDYNIALDYVVDQAIQTAMRMSVRNIKSNSRTLLIVTDRTLAEAIHRQLNGLPTLLPPQKLIPRFKNFEPFYPSGRTMLSVKERDEVRAQDRERTKLRREALREQLAYVREHSKLYAELNRLQVTATRRRKVGKQFEHEDRLETLRKQFAVEKKKLVNEFLKGQG